MALNYVKAQLDVGDLLVDEKAVGESHKTKH